MDTPYTKILAALTRFVTWITTAANVTGTLVVLGLVAVVNYDIVARGVFHRPFHGAYELVQFALVLIVFLQLPDVVRVGRLTRSDGFLIVLGGRYPRVAAVLRRAIDTISAVLMTLIAVTIFPVFVEMWESQDYFGVPGVFTAPWWPIKLTIFASATLCAVVFVLKVLNRQPETSTPSLAASKASDS